ncbi:COG2426 family protein [Fusibacter ferrireducens]|uniref:Small multi-drug export protein n=1 Tax=Fusibacter ferrireducens TaxID=2785058 RepID=A0ABR9ZXA8_9FIRM|nr:small multi-drug export protein [Fusibacter ferrireducens]MBF4695108.1 small multi-drug export protein [Fusibacter ferrireducens]
MLEFLKTVLTNEFKVIFTAALPVIEIKGAIPLGLSLGMNPWHTLLISLLGSIMPVPFILFGIRPVFNWLKHAAFFRKITDRIESKTLNKSHRIQKYGVWGLFLFVAIPLPGTGVWTGSLAAVLLDIRFKWAFPAILIGNLVAGIIIFSLSNGVISLFRF